MKKFIERMKRGGWIKPGLTLLFMIFSQAFCRNLWAVLGLFAFYLGAFWIASGRD